MESAHAYCGHCGHAYPGGAPWPRTCANCGRISYLNPVPVAVALVPIDGGLLAVRRGIEPGRGRLALPGGYINVGETWQAACAREVNEETGVSVDPAQVREFAVRSAPDGALLVFGLAATMRGADLPPFKPDAETLECVIVDRPLPMAFPLHTEVVEEYFQRRREKP